MVAAFEVGNFGRPKGADGPVRPVRKKDCAGLLPVYQVPRVQQRKLRSPFGRGGAGPIIPAHPDDGRIGMIARDDGVFIRGFSALRRRNSCAGGQCTNEQAAQKWFHGVSLEKKGSEFNIAATQLRPFLKTKSYS